jgi:hypothetical protein
MPRRSTGVRNLLRAHSAPGDHLREGAIEVPDQTGQALCSIAVQGLVGDDAD